MSLSPALLTAHVNPAKDPFVSLTLITEGCTFNLAWHVRPELLRAMADEIEQLGKAVAA